MKATALLGAEPTQRPFTNTADRAAVGLDM